MVRARKRSDLRVDQFLTGRGVGQKILEFKKDQTVFSQGDDANAVYYIQNGSAKVTVTSQGGQEATIAILGTGDFLGEECIALLQPRRLSTAIALTTTAIVRVSRSEILRLVHEKPLFSDVLFSFLLARNLRFQEDLIDQLFNSSERRLARALLLLAQFGKEGQREKVIPTISQETLAQMVGTTRSRISFFMNRFRKLGFIEYNGSLVVHTSLLNVVLLD
jgi:CRP/FNR family transcriptional regulator, cyclic AMP receptor protein